MSGYPETCPACHADLVGDDIPEHMREHYGPPYKWMRVLGISDWDSVYAWQCPDCSHVWSREGAKRTVTGARR